MCQGKYKVAEIIKYIIIFKTIDTWHNSTNSLFEIVKKMTGKTPVTKTDMQNPYNT